jgi:hypothetical protein
VNELSCVRPVRPRLSAVRQSRRSKEHTLARLSWVGNQDARRYEVLPGPRRLDRFLNCRRFQRLRIFVEGHDRFMGRGAAIIVGEEGANVDLIVHQLVVDDDLVRDREDDELRLADCHGSLEVGIFLDSVALVLLSGHSLQVVVDFDPQLTILGVDWYVRSILLESSKLPKVVRLLAHALVNRTAQGKLDDGDEYGGAELPDEKQVLVVFAERVYIVPYIVEGASLGLRAYSVRKVRRLALPKSLMSFQLTRERIVQCGS